MVRALASELVVLPVSVTVSSWVSLGIPKPSSSSAPLRLLAVANADELSVHELVMELLELLAAVVWASALEAVTPALLPVAPTTELSEEVAVSVHVEFVNHGMGDPVMFEDADEEVIKTVGAVVNDDV